MPKDIDLGKPESVALMEELEASSETPAPEVQVTGEDEPAATPPETPKEENPLDLKDEDFAEETPEATPEKEEEIPPEWTPDERKKFQPAMKKQAERWKKRLDEAKATIAPPEVSESQFRTKYANALSIGEEMLKYPDFLKAVVSVTRGEMRIVPAHEGIAEPTAEEMEAAREDPKKLMEIMDRRTNAHLSRERQAQNDLRAREATEKEKAEAEYLWKQHVEEVKADPRYKPIYDNPLALRKAEQYIERIPDLLMDEALELVAGQAWIRKNQNLRSSKRGEKPPVEQRGGIRANQPVDANDQFTDEIVKFAPFVR